jgi:single-strand DNA-binding protein
MSNDINNLEVTGRITRDAVVKQTQSGWIIYNFSLAINGSKKVSGQWQDTTTFLDVSYFSKENLKFLKGQSKRISGRIEQQTWIDKKTGNKRSKLCVIAKTVEDFQFQNHYEDKNKIKQPDPQQQQDHEEQPDTDIPF